MILVLFGLLEGVLALVEVEEYSTKESRFLERNRNTELFQSQFLFLITE